MTLRHVLWIGGAPGAGKTTVALRLARRYGLRWYGADTRTWQHRDRALRAGIAAAHRWESMTVDERWGGSTPQEMLTMSLHRERGPMVLDDLAALPDAPLVVAEGTTLPASVVSRGIAAASRAVWLLPTPQFQQASLRERNLAPGPATLYSLLGETIAAEAAAHGAPTLTIDGYHRLAAVEDVFAEALAEGPHAPTRDERRALLREANEAIAHQVPGYHARPWAVGDPETVPREFVCECGDRSCAEYVVMPVGALSSGPALAPGHPVQE